MQRKIFVNLPVEDLKRSMLFFAQLGFQFQPQFTDENAACMIVGEHSFVMLLVRPFYQGFTTKPISDAHLTSEVMVALSASSREEVNLLADTALRIGGKPSGPVQEHGFMYSRSFQDPDGHIWEVVWMDESAVPQ